MNLNEAKPEMGLYIKWIRCLESFPDHIFDDLREFEHDYDEGKVALQKQLEVINMKLKVVLLENDTLKDIMERK